jgi:GNAT superfamily N-acetyltransferase
MTEGITARLRPLVAADSSFLVEMLLEAVNWHPERSRLSMASVLADSALSHYVADWPRPDDGGVLAIADEQPVGAAWWRFFTGVDPGYGFVAADIPELSMGVVADWRGRGVGRALLRATKQAAAARCRQISLSVERANRARDLYVSEGFRVLAGGPDSDTMICDLDSASRGVSIESGATWPDRIRRGNRGVIPYHGNHGDGNPSDREVNFTGTRQRGERLFSSPRD